MPIARVNGVSLYYEVAGRGAPLVLVHGFACGIRSWDPLFRSLSRYRRVITYDVRGHGLSDAPPEAAAYSQATSVADLHALLEHLKIGNIALNFALAHPAMVSALIVADTGAGSEEAGDWAAGLRAFADVLNRGGVEAFADMAVAHPLFARYVAQGPEAERLVRSCLMTHRARGLAHTALEVLAKRPSIYSLDARLRALGVPTLLIVGEYDTPCLKPHRFLADVMPKARHVVLRGVGHLTNLEAPAAFNAAVKSFLRLRAALRPGH